MFFGHKKKIDRTFLAIVVALIVSGLFIFVSASLGILAISPEKFRSILFNQLVLGLLFGTIAAYIASRIPYSFWQKYAFYIFVLATICMLLVFVPGIGLNLNGAKRWITVLGYSFQPAELYKIGFVLYLAALLASVKNKIQTFRYGILPYIILVAITAGIVLAQPDTDTFIVIAVSGMAMFISAGGRWRDIFIIGLIGLIGLGILVMERPYLMKRIQTFMNPAADPSGSSYQIQQSLIAIGSGGLTGRGFGQSIQKFTFLPYSNGDSVFAIIGEEFGFAGSVFIIFLYLLFTFKGYRIAIRSPDTFSGMLVVGIITLITLQSFINIAAMLAIIPLSGTPLLFISHGGTALFFAIASLGIVFNVSRYQKANN